MTIALLSVSDPFVVITRGEILVVPMDCNLIWAKSILMASKVRLKNFKGMSLCEIIVIIKDYKMPNQRQNGQK